MTDDIVTVLRRFLGEYDRNDACLSPGIELEAVRMARSLLELGTAAAAANQIEPTVRWRGSVGDLCADLRGILKVHQQLELARWLSEGKYGDPEAVPMLLWCPECRARHIDVGAVATKRHHTHSCQSCGMTWRPAAVDTVGVRFLPGFKDPAGTGENGR